VPHQRFNQALQAAENQKAEAAGKRSKVNEQQRSGGRWDLISVGSSRAARHDHDGERDQPDARRRKIE